MYWQLRLFIAIIHLNSVQVGILLDDIFAARVWKRNQIWFVDFANFGVYGKITLNIDHLHFVNLCMCGSCINYCLYMLVINYPEVFPQGV